MISTVTLHGCHIIYETPALSPVSSTNKTDRNDTTGVLLNVALNTMNLTLLHNGYTPI
jgi:hypothetical protein